MDGSVTHSDAGQTWATLIAAAGNWSADSDATGLAVYINSAATLWNWAYRNILLFDTSGLPDSAVISATTFSIYGFNKDDNLSCTPDVNVYSSNPTSNISLTGTDYATLGSTPFCDTAITYANWKTADPFWNDFAFNNDGIAAISKTSISKFGLRNVNYDVGATEPNWVASSHSRLMMYFADQGAGYKPKLVVTYTTIEEKTSSDAGSGAESLGSRLFGAAETGWGTGASSLLAVLTGTVETGLGSEFAAKIFSTFDSGSGIDAVIARLLAATETGSSVEVALLIAALISSDGGVGSDLSTLLKAILAGDVGSGVEALKALIETAGSDMRLRARPGQVRIPSKGVNL